ncbi:MAG: flagellar filament capping protein FliD [Bdellovibrionia bacterium]
MAGIRITGMASGLPPNIVEQIMDAERIPVKNMEGQVKKEDDKLKLVTELETKVTDITKNLNELTGSGGFLDKKFVSGDANVVDGTVDPNTAIAGEYQIEVIQLAQKPAAISKGFADRDKTTLGTGYLKFETGDGVKEVYIKKESSTLDGVARQINNSGLGLKAQVLEDRKDPEAPFKLVVSGLKTGADNKVTFPTIYLLDGDEDMYFEDSRPAQNAKIKVDGFEVEIPENQVKDLVPGVTLDLKGAAPGRPIRMTVKEDLEVISGKVKTFVDSYNAALSFIQSQNKLQAGPGGNQRLGPLGGDSLLRTVENTLRRAIQNPQLGVQSPVQRLNELGIEFNRNGTLEYNQKRFESAVAANPQGVAAFLRGDGFATGFVNTLKRDVSNLTNNAFGVLANRKKGLTDKIKQMNQRIDNKEKQLEKKEDTLRKKFSDLETKMSQLNQQGSAFQAMAQKAPG